MALTDSQKAAAARRQAEYRKRRKLKDPSGAALMVRNQNLKHKFGITHEDFLVLYETQGGCCKICGKAILKDNPRRNVDNGSAIDHCHKTGAIRGILCHHCNVGLGYFLDDPKLLRLAANYLLGEA